MANSMFHDSVIHELRLITIPLFTVLNGLRNYDSILGISATRSSQRVTPHVLHEDTI